MHYTFIYGIAQLGPVSVWQSEWKGRCIALRWRHNGRDSVSNHQTHHRLLKRLFRRRSKKTSKLRVTGLCAANSPGTGEFPAQMASNAENVSIWWRHHGRLAIPIYVNGLDYQAKTKMINCNQIMIIFRFQYAWWRHKWETSSALLTLCAGNSTAPVSVGTNPLPEPMLTYHQYGSVKV